jgi:adenine-specific DNA-methyltransferase
LNKKNQQPQEEPKLLWLNDKQERDVDICDLYRHEFITPEILMDKFTHFKEVDLPEGSTNDLFGNHLNQEKKISNAYQHQENWTNRFIQGDSLLVMASLLEQEEMAEQVQMIYFDPPYGIQFKAEWHKQMNVIGEENRKSESGETEKIAAYRDTWKFGIHSYLSHLRDRLIIAKKLLSPSGACFVQISDENVHLVRCIMDEVFGRENFIATIILKTRSNSRHKRLSILNDYIIFYAKETKHLKYHQLYHEKELDLERFHWVELDNGEVVNIGQLDHIDKSLRPFASEKIQSYSGAGNTIHPFEYKGKIFKPSPSRGWRCSVGNLKKLEQKNRLVIRGNSLRYKYYFDDFPANQINNLWVDQLSEPKKSYVVQTATTVIQRCLLMTTDPGDLVLDPTCGSGTTAEVAEQWGRRWICIDTSRIALNIAKKRLMTALFPYYKLHDEKGHDIRQGFIYKKCPHTTMRTVIYDEPPIIEILYDKVQEDKNKLRITGPFTLETLKKNLDPPTNAKTEQLIQRIFEQLKAAGVKNGLKHEKALLTELKPLSGPHLHAEGFYNTSQGKKKAYFHIGPQFGSVSKRAVNAARRECVQLYDANWLIILSFSFENKISNETVKTRYGHFELTKVCMHDDLLQEDFKEDKRAASFITIGEPNIQVHKKNNTVQIEICGFNIYNPIKDKMEARNINENIAYWMIDDDYDGQHFVVKQVFFCGGNKKEFQKWQKALSHFAKKKERKKVHKTLKIAIDETAFARVYHHLSHPITIQSPKQKMAVKTISQLGEENTTIIEVV